MTKIILREYECDQCGKHQIVQNDGTGTDAPANRVRALGWTIENNTNLCPQCATKAPKPCEYYS